MFAHLRIFSDREGLRQELVALNVAEPGIDIMAPKAEYYCIKVTDIAPQDALILKQEMLSIGGEVAISQHAMPPHSKIGAILVMGTFPQLGRLAKKLTKQYERTYDIGQALLSVISNVHKRHILPFPQPIDVRHRTAVMGVLNVTPDSFFPGSCIKDVDQVVLRAGNMITQGADIIDVGGVSTRPGAQPVEESEEISRVVPVIEAITSAYAIPVSVDTSSARVAAEALVAGASMVNDVMALRGDPDMITVVKEHDVPVCLMHMQGTPQAMQRNPAYKDIMADIAVFLHQQAGYAMENGIAPEKIILDPGIGFGKRTGEGIEDNCTILARLRELKSLGFPLLVGASRKAFIGNLTGCPVNDRLAGSLGAGAMAICHGADILRVHDVAATRQMALVVDTVVK